MKLYLDSTDNTKTIVRLDDKEFVNEVVSPRDQNIFGFLLKCLDSVSAKPQDITDITVNTGPGSFTGTRIGVTIANALGYSLGVLVNGQKPPVEAIYSSPPSITQPK